LGVWHGRQQRGHVLSPVLVSNHFLIPSSQNVIPASWFSPYWYQYQRKDVRRCRRFRTGTKTIRKMPKIPYWHVKKIGRCRRFIVSKKNCWWFSGSKIHCWCDVSFDFYFGKTRTRRLPVTMLLKHCHYSISGQTVVRGWTSVKITYWGCVVLISTLRKNDTIAKKLRLAIPKELWKLRQTPRRPQKFSYSTCTGMGNVTTVRRLWKVQNSSEHGLGKLGMGQRRINQRKRLCGQWWNYRRWLVQYWRHPS
jgi:hypothetical protein